MQSRPRLLVVIPTRNRSEFAARAIQSALKESEGSDATVVVSDNSTIPLERQRLALCDAAVDPRLHYIRPPKPLPMAAHWEWALARSLELADATHVLYLTDRMIFRPGELQQLERTASRNPELVVSYNNEIVDDIRRPVTVLLQEWSGRIAHVKSTRLLELASLCIFSRALPRMLNSLTPRSLLLEMRQRFGTVFDSISPDYCFAFRCLGITHELIYYDMPVVIAYGLDRSNGTSVARGVDTPDTVDFFNELGTQSFNHAAPLPELRLSSNAMVHEYCIVRSEFGDTRFPPLRADRYLARMARDLKLVEDPDNRRRMYDVLRENGWENWRRPLWSASSAVAVLAYHRTPAAIVGRIRETSSGRKLLRLVGGWRDHGLAPRFDSVDDALGYATTNRGLKTRKPPRF